MKAYLAIYITLSLMNKSIIKKNKFKKSTSFFRLKFLVKLTLSKISHSPIRLEQLGKLNHLVPIFSRIRRQGSPE